MIPIQSGGSGGGVAGAAAAEAVAAGKTPRAEGCVPYFEKESKRRAAEIVAEVAQLEKWRPATPLAATGKDKEDGSATAGQNAQQTTQQKAK